METVADLIAHLQQIDPATKLLSRDGQTGDLYKPQGLRLRTAVYGFKESDGSGGVWDVFFDNGEASAAATTEGGFVALVI